MMDCVNGGQLVQYYRHHVWQYEIDSSLLLCMVCSHFLVDICTWSDFDQTYFVHLVLFFLLPEIIANCSSNESLARKDT